MGVPPPMKKLRMPPLDGGGGGGPAKVVGEKWMQVEEVIRCRRSRGVDVVVVVEIRESHEAMEIDACFVICGGRRWSKGSARPPGWWSCKEAER